MPYGRNRYGTTRYGATGTHIGTLLAGAVAIEPAVDLALAANYIAASAVATIEPEADIAAIANYIAGVAVGIGPGVDLESIANRLLRSGVDITVAASLVEVAEIIRDGHAALTPAVAVESAAIALFSGAAAITPELSLALNGAKLASAVLAVTPQAEVEAIGNYITLAVATIALAVSQSALCTKVIDAGTVSITISASVSVTALKYIFMILGLSGDLSAGSIIEIDTKNMTFKIDGTNALKDMVGDWTDVYPGDSTVTYEDDEVSRDVTLDLEYTPRDG